MKLTKLFIVVAFISNANVSFADTVKTNINSKTKVDVQCPNKVDHRDIIRTEKGVWCDAIFYDNCSTNKIKAARKVCTQDYAKRLKRWNESNLGIPEDAVKKSNDAYSQELKRLDLEAERIVLKKQQLDLRKRELELLKKEQGLN